MAETIPGTLGWDRVNRALDRGRKILAEAANEEDFQNVGLSCREALISPGQVVWDLASDFRYPVAPGRLVGRFAVVPTWRVGGLYRPSPTDMAKPQMPSNRREDHTGP